MTRNLFAVATVLVATTLALAGCSGSSHSSKSAGAIAGGDFAASSAAAGSAESGVGVVAQPAAEPTGGTTPAPLKSTALILTANLTVQTKNVVQQAAGAVRIATAAGGSVTSEVVTDAATTGSTHTPANANLTLAVPPSALQSTLTQLDALGVEQSRQLSSQDVTGQVADVTSRVSSAEASIARLQTLFAQATKVSDIVDIENELSQREADLESLQAQQRVLDAQTAFATITLQLVSTPVTTLARHHSTPRGFGTGLRHGWHAFAASVAWALTALGASLPFLIIVVLAGGAFLALRRRGRAKILAQPAATGPSGEGISE